MKAYVGSDNGIGEIEEVLTYVAHLIVDEFKLGYAWKNAVIN